MDDTQPTRNRNQDREFHKLGDHLETVPKDIEGTAELEEFIEHVAEKTAPLEEMLEELVAYSEKVLVPARFRVTEQQSHAMFDASGWPFRIKAKVESAQERCRMSRESFLEELEAEQTAFLRTMDQLAHDVTEYMRYDKLAQVDEASAEGLKIQQRLKEAEEKALLF